MKPLILFLCPHNAAKSILAAAFCQKLATQQGLDWQIASAGTEPDAEISPAIIKLLASEGLDVTNQTPRHVTQEELESAYRIISLGCDVNDLVSKRTQVEYWNDVPPPSQSLLEARDLIHTKVEKFVNDLRHSISFQE